MRNLKPKRDNDNDSGARGSTRAAEGAESKQTGTVGKMSQRITGLETELALSLMQLYHAKRLSLADLIAKYTVAPARLLRIPKGDLRVGSDADVTVFDPDREWKFDPATTASKSLNSPFYLWPLRGKAVATIVGGRKVWCEQSELSPVHS